MVASSAYADGGDGGDPAEPVARTWDGETSEELDVNGFEMAESDPGANSIEDHVENVIEEDVHVLDRELAKQGRSRIVWMR